MHSGARLFRMSEGNYSNEVMANTIALYKLMDWRGFTDDFEIIGIVDKCACAHVYDTDRALAERVRLVPAHPHVG